MHVYTIRVMKMMKTIAMVMIMMMILHLHTLIQIEIKMGKNLVHKHNTETGFYKLFHPAIPDGRTSTR